MTLLLLWACRCGSPDDSAPEVRTREPCTDFRDERQVLWGDTHVHTGLSFDAWAYDVTAGPEDAWDYARGGTLDLGYGELALDRPLDFAVITDHAEYLAEIPACTDPDSPGYMAETCVTYREASTSTKVQLFGVKMSLPDPDRFEDICAMVDCETSAADTWDRVQDAAEQAYDRTATCGFTSFVGYEWSGTTNVANLHRNVIFKSWKVPHPTTYFDVQTGHELWDALERDCLDGIDGCDVLAIPHNGNTSNGNLFLFEGDALDAERRAAFEPLVEVYQHKGDSECRMGFLNADEECRFEKVRLDDELDDCGEETGSGGLTYAGCQADRDFLRGTLAYGLEMNEDIGANPFPLGVIASTDTHSATPGRVDEETYLGHLGIAEDEPLERLASPRLNPGGVINSGGGLAAVWAEENSRESIFDAMRRREVYGTSGPRIEVRVYGGDVPVDACEGDFVAAGEGSSAVPMGGVLPGGEPARFAVHALADGTGLERIQLVRGVLVDGQVETEVIDLVGEPLPDPDPETCESSVGDEELCVVWEDPDWSGEPAFWYVRVLEAPTCRWSWQDCLSLPEEERPDNCFAEDVPWAVRERAWTSAIWSEEAL
ncbi:MAG: DUF3604 domain-containing protein [Proteobacteria bacterium]|nr:DUF3604 domain-containing protein [Pseudomonadota bacterium]MCP4919418.1 DUF3604 domain-containing protein [Pseudomonadota bacterium]